MAESEFYLEVIEEVFDLLEVAEKGDPGLDGTGGDMVKSVYDPTTVEGDAFDMDNMAESVTAKVLTGTERSKLVGVEAGAEVNPDDMSDAEVVAGTDATPKTPTAAQLKLAVDTHGGGGGGGGGWEFEQMLEVVGSAVQEIDFTGLDFLTYEYRVRGEVFCTSAADEVRVYSVEPDIASVSVANYNATDNSSYMTSSHQDSQAQQNRIGQVYSLTSTVWIIQNLRVYRLPDGIVMFDNIDYLVNIVTFNGAPTLGLRLHTSNTIKKNSTTHFAVYHATGAFLDVGTKLIMDRRELQ